MFGRIDPFRDPGLRYYSSSHSDSRPTLKKRSHTKKKRPRKPITHAPTPIPHLPNAPSDRSNTVSPPSAEFFNPRLPEDVKEVLKNSLAKGTAANYQSAVRTFLAFCDTHNVHRHLRLPSDEFVLCTFAASLAKKFSGSYAQSFFSGLKAWHIMHDAEWRGGQRLQLVLRGVARLAPATSRRDPRKPITLEMLSILQADLDLSSQADAAILAIALTAFWGQCRLGELIGTSRSKHDGSQFPSRSSLGPTISTNGSRELKLPHTKTSQDLGETIVLTKQHPPCDAITAINHHLSLRPGASPSDHLFAFASNGKARTSIPTKESFLARVNQVWMRAGYPRMTGHSFRIGGTTALLKAGIPPDVVRKMGRWSSDAHLKYWRDLTEIATSQAELIHGTSTQDTHRRHA